MTRAPSGRPIPGEFAPYAQSDIDAVVGTDAVTILQELAVATQELLESLREDQVSGLRYAPNKWTLPLELEILEAARVLDRRGVTHFHGYCLGRCQLADKTGPNA